MYFYDDLRKKIQTDNVKFLISFVSDITLNRNFELSIFYLKLRNLHTDGL